jgi:hypothetical protein
LQQLPHLSKCSNTQTLPRPKKLKNPPHLPVKDIPRPPFKQKNSKKLARALTRDGKKQKNAEKRSKKWKSAEDGGKTQ